MTKGIERKVSEDEVAWVQDNGPTYGVILYSLGFLKIQRETGTSLNELHKKAINETTEDNHFTINSTIDFLRSHADRFGLKE